MSLVLGVGFRKSAPLGALQEVIKRVLEGHETPDFITTIDRKSTDEKVQIIARELGAKIIFVSEDRHKGIKTPTQSDIIQDGFGTGSIAESCALVSGENTRIITPRMTSHDGTATAALAIMETEK